MTPFRIEQIKTTKSSVIFQKQPRSIPWYCSRLRFKNMKTFLFPTLKIFRWATQKVEMQIKISWLSLFIVICDEIKAGVLLQNIITAKSKHQLRLIQSEQWSSDLVYQK